MRDEVPQYERGKLRQVCTRRRLERFRIRGGPHCGITKPPRRDMAVTRVPLGITQSNMSILSARQNNACGRPTPMSSALLHGHVGNKPLTRAAVLSGSPRESPRGPAESFCSASSEASRSGMCLPPARWQKTRRGGAPRFRELISERDPHRPRLSARVARLVSWLVGGAEIESHRDVDRARDAYHRVFGPGAMHCRRWRADCTPVLGDVERFQLRLEAAGVREERGGGGKEHARSRADDVSPQISLPGAA